MKTLVTAALLLFASGLMADVKTPLEKGDVAIIQRLDTQLPLELDFKDETGRKVKLGEYFKSGRPVLLTMVYYRCPMLCNIVMEGLTQSMRELRFSAGKEFDVLAISFDPRDTPAEAKKRKTTLVRRYGRAGSDDGVHFLTGNAESIRQITDAIGFRYSYDKERDQFAHGSMLTVLTPGGKISRYFYGFEYNPRDVRLGLVEASSGKIGSPTDQILLLCFHYDPATGKYSRVAMNFVRLGGTASALGLAGFIFVMIRKERQQALQSGENENL